jgi:hypothetical protein
MFSKILIFYIKSKNNKAQRLARMLKMAVAGEPGYIFILKGINLLYEELC